MGQFPTALKRMKITSALSIRYVGRGGGDRRDTPNSKSHCSMALQPLLSATVDSVDLDELAEAPKGD